MKLEEAQYAKTLYEITKGKSQDEIDGVLSNFTKLLIKNNQTKLVNRIIEKFNNLWNKEEGIVEAEIVSICKLDSDQISKIENFIKSKYDIKEVLIKNTIDREIKGGVIIKVGDDILDGSIKGKLKNLKNNLSK